jgi:DNA-binding response OmpR family regulator
MYNLLLIEDSQECQLVVKCTLSRPDIDILTTTSISATKAFIGSPEFNREIHLILLDLVLPDGDGMELLHFFQTHDQFRHVPVFLLTCRNEITSKVTAFSLGAEDYLTKPIHPLELKARLEMRLQKNYSKVSQKNVITKKDLTLNVSMMKAYITVNDIKSPLDLTSKEFKILLFLIQNEGQTYTRTQLVKHIWGESIHVLDRTIDSHVCGLRRKLKHLASYIECIPNVGYRFFVSYEPTKSSHQFSDHSSQTR